MSKKTRKNHTSVNIEVALKMSDGSIKFIPVGAPRPDGWVKSVLIDGQGRLPYWAKKALRRRIPNDPKAAAAFVRREARKRGIDPRAAMRRYKDARRRYVPAKAAKLALG